MDSRQFQKLLGGIRKCIGSSNIRMNMSQLESVDASGLSMLLMAHDLAKSLRRQLVFEKPYGQVEESLKNAAHCNRLTIAA